jgi:hypothetical protein
MLIFFENLRGASMDFTSLAKGLTEYLLPFLPFLWEMGKGAAEQATQGAIQKFGADAWDRAKGLWKPLRAKSETHPTLLEAVNDVVEEPTNGDRQGFLREQLRKLFKQEPDFAQELANLLAQAQLGGVSSCQSQDVTFGKGVSKSTITTGNNNSIGDTYNVTNSIVGAVGRGAKFISKSEVQRKET